MKRLFFIAFLLLAIGAQSATVVFNFQNFISGSIANRPFVITPLSTPTVSSTNIISSDIITTNTANGTISVAAVVAGSYRCEIKTPVTTKPVMTTTFQITVPDTNGTVDASTIITASTNVSSGSVAYSAAAADARFLRRDEQFAFDTNQMTVTGTNVVFKRGAVVTNLVVKNSGLGPALSLADGASMRLTNGVATFGSNSTVNIGDGSGLGSAEIRFDSTATVSDYTGSDRWNFKTPVGGGKDANTVAKLDDITNGVGIGKTIYIDSVNGNDATAARGTPKAYSTMTNAVAALQSGDTLMVRPGNYWVNTFGSPSTILSRSNGPALNMIGVSNVAIIGIGKPNLIFSNNVTGLCLRNVQNFRIEGLVFNWTNKPAAANITNLITAIDLEGTTANGVISKTDFLNCPDQAICPCLLSSGRTQTNMVITDCYFENVGYSTGVPTLGGDGTPIVPASGWIITNNRFHRCFRGVEYQVFAPDVIRGGTCANNKFTQMTGPSICWFGDTGAGTSEQFSDLVISGNTVREQQSPASVPFYCTGGGLARVLIANNTFSTDGTGGGIDTAINLQATGGTANRNVSILNNIIETPATWGVVAHADSSSIFTNAVISQNIFLSCVEGVYLTAAGSEVCGNKFLGGAERGANNGVQVDNVSGRVRWNRIFGNVMMDTGGAGVIFQAGSSNNYVFNNYFERCGQSVKDLNPLGFNSISANQVAGRTFNGTNELGPLQSSVPLFNQWFGTTVTNITTATNQLFGTGDGSRVTGAGFWTRNKTARISLAGQYWTGATPGNCLFMLNLDTSSSTNTLTKTLFAPPANQAGSAWNLDVIVTCMTNSATGAFMAEGTLTTLSGSTPTTHTFTNAITVVSTLPEFTINLGVTNGASTDSYRSFTGGILVR